MADTNGASTGRTPRWVKVQGAFVVLLILVVVAMSSGLLGGHGHGDSMSHRRTMGGH